LKETLKVEATIIKEPPEKVKETLAEDLGAERDEKGYTTPRSEFWRDKECWYEYDSDRSLSSEDMATMAGNPHFWTNTAKRRDEEWKKKQEEESRKKATKRAKAAEKRANRQTKKLLVQEATIGKEDPAANKPRTDGN
jgi:hypothetical protein